MVTHGDLRGVKPTGYDDPVLRRGADTAQAPEAETAAGIERELTTSWSISRAITKAANALAADLAAVSDHVRAAVARGVAVRHGDVWREIDLFQGDGDIRSKKERGYAPVRPDAGDASDPFWWRREADRRSGTMLTLVTAARLLDWRVVTTALPPCTRAEAEKIRQQFASATWRAVYGITAAEPLTVPAAGGNVRLHYIVALHPDADERHLTRALKVACLPRLDEDDPRETLRQHYLAMVRAFEAVGPKEWVRAYVDRVNADGRRSRDRGVGAFARAKAFLSGVMMVAPQPADDASTAQIVREHQIVEAATALAGAAALAGDLVAGAEALRRARAAVADAKTAFGKDAPGSMAIAALELLVGLSARALANERRRQRKCGAAQINYTQHTTLLTRIRALPGPIERAGSGWCWVERIRLDVQTERARAATWMAPPSKVPNCRCCYADLTSPSERARGICDDCASVGIN
jgi:hypothetical protein